METLTLNINGIANLNEIREAIENRKPLTQGQQLFLLKFLTGLPLPSKFLLDKTGTDIAFRIQLFDIDEMQPCMSEWIEIYKNMPGKPQAKLIEHPSSILNENVVVQVLFFPSLKYKQENRMIELHLKADSTACFHITTLKDAESYPELYSFIGSWRDAYLVLVKVMMRGWPQVEFPKELSPFLPTKG